jgi:hypothetical protein
LLLLRFSNAVRERLALPDRRFPIQLSGKDIQPLIARGTFDVSNVLFRVSLFEELKAKSLKGIRVHLF